MEKKPVRRKVDQPFHAKIASPKAGEIAPRPRLHLLLDQAASKPMTWISAQAGSGKTTLAVEYLHSTQASFLWYNCDQEDSYPSSFFYYIKQAARQNFNGRAASLPLLQPEYLAGVTTFTRRFFEQLSSFFLPENQTMQRGRTAPGVIVLDNYQDLPANAQLHSLLSFALEGLQGRARMLVLSREEPPAPLIRLLANGQIVRLDDEDLRFTHQEASALVETLQPHLQDATIEQIYERTHGWAAGMTLLLESLTPVRPSEAPELNCDSIFDYFAGEIFQALGEDVKLFLLRAAVLPIIYLPVVEKLTQYPQSRQLLNAFCRNNLFTKKLSGSNTEFQFHPLLREFLLNSLSSQLPAAEFNELRRQAGQLLEEHHHYEDAARLYGETGATQELTRLIRTHAAQLLQQGRNHILQEWLKALPEGDSDDPWLTYWRGMCSFPLNIPLACQQMDKALQQFSALKDRKGTFLAWAGLVDAYTYSLDKWRSLLGCLDFFEQHLGDGLSFPDKETERTVISSLLTALALVRTDQTWRIEFWLERIQKLQEETPSIELKVNTIFNLILFYLWKGEYQKNVALIENALTEMRSHKLPALIQIRILLMVGIQAYYTAEYEQGKKSLQDAQQIATESGVHVFDSLLWNFLTAISLASGDLQQATITFEQQAGTLVGPTHLLNQTCYYSTAVWMALLEGQPQRAHQHMQMAAPLVEHIGAPYIRALWHIGMGITLFQLDQPDQAFNHLQSGSYLAISMQSTVLEWNISLIKAWIYLQQKHEAEGIACLRRALELARAYHYVHLEFYLPQMMQFLLAHALEEDIEPEYSRLLVRKLSLDPPVAQPGNVAFITANWPYAIKIYTMGSFEILLDGAPLAFSGKEQKKPLEMLKLLIAQGGVNVPEEQLSDQLWPDADGDLAHKSFETNLGRLRRLLETDSCVLYRGRKLSLNPRICWVDSLALRQQLQAVHAGQIRYNAPSFQRALRLAKNVFLPVDQGFDSIQVFRSQLNEELLHALLALGKLCEEKADFEAAIEAYQQGIALDRLGEEFYRRIMLCQCRLGSHSNAARTYLECREQLRYHLGIEPSPQTTAIYQSLGQKNK
ncbi:BTAD domain-containing putative transcriptional regulator [Telmatobacter bradus]|uniref:BTAD domain-containing putative transcriptional regulator n=1 Tax=Telmatobacter bradus TaxID=474953 RepID=UPI003B42F634